MTNIEKYQADPRFQLLVDMDRLLTGDRIWGGMDWSYNPIHPFKYLPMLDRVRRAPDDLKQEYGIAENE
jgi:hypothetical protein